MEARLSPEVPPVARIRARSERQAMDWSLVLVSQGIEVRIEDPADTGVWELAVAPEDLERALTAIRVYRVENRGWAWRQRLVWSGWLFHWGALLWCWFMIVLYWLSEAAGPQVVEAGVVNSVRVGEGEYWRWVTAVSLHADVGHLASNASTGLIVFGLAMARFGAGWALLGGLISGVAGNVLSWGLREGPYTGLGASGMVMGGLGMLAAQSVFLIRMSRRPLRQVVTAVVAGCLLFVLIGLNPASDVLAHAGGFGAGLGLGALLAWLPDRWGQNRRLEQWAGGTAIVVFGMAWALALWSVRN